MSDIERLFSKDPAVLAELANEAIEHLKSELAKFDASQQHHHDRLRAYLDEAKAEGDAECSRAAPSGPARSVRYQSSSFGPDMAAPLPHISRRLA